MSSLAAIFTFLAFFFFLIFNIRASFQVVMIPEYVYSAHVHQVLQPEPGKIIKIVPPETALVFHLRFIELIKILVSLSTNLQ